MVAPDWGDGVRAWAAVAGTLAIVYSQAVRAAALLHKTFTRVTEERTVGMVWSMANNVIGVSLR